MSTALYHTVTIWRHLPKDLFIEEKTEEKSGEKTEEKSEEKSEERAGEIDEIEGL